ncbi:MAG TPA: histone deacetylase [Chloroflexia bacterium]|nr:histone deacetylase [Chloroflexia bacterium]
MSRTALIYSPDFSLLRTSEISLRGNDVVHYVAGQELVDPVYTVAKLQYPYAVPERVPNPEQPARSLACYESLAAFGLVGDAAGQMLPVVPRSATLNELAAVHSHNYINRVRAVSDAGGGELGESTYIGENSFQWAGLSAGAGLTALEVLFSGAADNAMVITRPPGHHARRESAAGFCVFNNVAVLAEACRRHYGLQKILIVDWDLHHGDGTQEIFYNDAGVLFCSLHQFGPELYPEKGDFNETGTGAGLGYTVNLPLPAKTGDDAYLALFQRVIPALAAFYRPDIILVSAGYDAHFNDTQNLYVWDPAGGLCLSAQAYSTLTEVVKSCAEQYCQGRYIVLLEGGYNLYSLPASVVNTAATMLGLDPLITERLPVTVPVAALDVNAYLEKLGRYHPNYHF